MHHISKETKVGIYQAVVITTLLYGCETWSLYRQSICRMDHFHLCCLRKIAGMKWQDRVTNTDVLSICGTTGIEAFLLKAQLRWVSHVMCMPDSRIPKQVYCGQLAVGSRPQCGPVRRYRHRQGEYEKIWNEPVYSRQRFTRPLTWRSLCIEAVTQFEDESRGSSA